jgi:hypothetical protein
LPQSEKYLKYLKGIEILGFACILLFFLFIISLENSENARVTRRGATINFQSGKRSSASSGAVSYLLNFVIVVLDLISSLNNDTEILWRQRSAFGVTCSSK